MAITPLPNEAATICEFIGDRLYFTSLAQIPAQHRQQTDDTVYFTIDNTLHYVPFFSDFGPMNMAHVYKFCHIMQNKLDAPSLQGKRICLYSSMESDKRANAAFLLCTYMLIVQGKTPDEAYKPLSGAVPAFVPFRDAGYGPATFYITILDCLRGLHKALIAGLINMDEFNLEEYERYEKVENGDFNWLTNKFIAFASPQDETQQTFANRPVSLPPKASQTFESVLQYFKENGVALVLRLNNKLYDKKKFLRAGIDHMEMYFPDGSCPSETILHNFLEVADRREGVIAVHCKAGLGRTGTLIGAWFMKEYKFTAAEVIAFLRVLRPGSVVGPQQNFLQSMQARLWKMDSQAGITRPPSRQVSRPQTPSTRPMEVDTDTLANAEARTGEYVIPAQPRKSPNERAAQLRGAPITVGSWKSAASPSPAPTFTTHPNHRERYNLRSNGPVSTRLSITGNSVAPGAQNLSTGGNYSADTALRSGTHMVPKQRTTAAYGYLFGGLTGSPGSSSSLSSPNPASAQNVASASSKTKKAVSVGKTREHR